MKHHERWQLAQQLTARMVATYPGEIVLGGVYGSTPKGTDTEWSDLELLFVAREGTRAAGKHFVYHGTAVGYRVLEQPRLEEILTHPTPQWPFYMGALSALHVLYGDAERVAEWLGVGTSVPPERFRSALEAALPELVVESYGRILSCRERRNTQDIRHSVIEVLYEMNRALCLLNGRWVMHDYFEGFVDAFAFTKLPDDYRNLVTALWSAVTIEEIVPLAERLTANFRRLLVQEGITVRDYQSVEELPL